MKRTIVKLLAVVACLSILCASLSSCGRLFTNEDGEFVGFDNIITFILGENEE